MSFASITAHLCKHLIRSSSPNKLFCSKSFKTGTSDLWTYWRRSQSKVYARRLDASARTIGSQIGSFWGLIDQKTAEEITMVDESAFLVLLETLSLKMALKSLVFTGFLFCDQF